MSMFCFQCQEAANGKACEIKGVCGKDAICAGLQDLLIYTAKGVSIYQKALREAKLNDSTNDEWLLDALFTTITNANFDKEAIEAKITKGLELRDILTAKANKENIKVEFSDQDAAMFDVRDREAMMKQAAISGVKRTENEDIRSLRELNIYGLKGLAAYAMHAANLGSTDADIIAHIENALVATLDDSLSADDLVGLTLETGKFGVEGMALLDAANTGRYGNPEISTVELGVGTRPGILISGHDLSDLEELLEQSKDSGIDIYTHSEMLPAHYYPELKKYSHLKGNYGGAWWQQVTEFETFNGPVLFTTNCIVPPTSKSTYTDKVFTTGSSGYPGFTHIVSENGKKDFSDIIELAKTCENPIEIETGTIVGGFAHNQVISLADTILDAINKGAIRKFVVMAGCDGRMKNRSYYEDFAQALPQDVIILTAGCAKYRYNKLDLGDISGIPRVLDAGQCNDSYSLAKIALTLRDALGLEDLNDLPIAYNIAWYEQKAVIVLLALLYLGIKNIHLGPTLPAFLSPNIVNVLVENFGIAGITTVDEDIKKMVG